MKRVPRAKQSPFFCEEPEDSLPFWMTTYLGRLLHIVEKKLSSFSFSFKGLFSYLQFCHKYTLLQKHFFYCIKFSSPFPPSISNFEKNFFWVLEIGSLPVRQEVWTFEIWWSWKNGNLYTTSSFLSSTHYEKLFVLLSVLKVSREKIIPEES